MQEFTSLTQAGQIRRLRALAVATLPEFGLDPAACRLRPLQHAENTTFCVDAADGDRYCLRIHRPDYQTTEALRSELDLLERIGEALGPVVPLPARMKVWAVEAEPGVPGVRRVTLLRWVYGRVMPRRPTAAVMRRHGAFMARLHRFAEGFTAPAGFVRQRLDGTTMFGRTFGESLTEVSSFLGAEEHAAIQRAIEHVAAVRVALGNGLSVFGLIHADLHRRNVLVGPGWDLRAIDFDDCGWGHYLSDMANATESLARHGPSVQPLLAAFLEGYRSVRTLEDEHAALLPVFYFDRTWTAVRWMLARQDSPFVRGITAEHVRICVRAALGVCG